MMQTVLLNFILILVITVAIINQNMWLRFKSKDPFNRLLGIASVYIGFHALSILAIEYFFLKNVLYDRFAPFALMYGPFLYFAFFVILHERLSVVKVWLHSGPFILFCMIYCNLVIKDMPDNLVFLYGRCLGLLTVISFSFYTILSMTYISRAIKEQHRKRKLVVIIAIVLLLFINMVLFVEAFSSVSIDDFKISAGLFRFLIYGGMLCCTLVINRFYRLMANGLAINSEELLAVELNLENSYEGKYKKSALTEAQLDVYLIKLNHLMNTQRVYLYQDLSLLKLAKLMRVPKHHITQVLNIKLKMNFYQYVNGFRIVDVCILLEENSIDTLENIALQSGFNSKSSFNRHFKAVKGLTPSEYRLSGYTNENASRH